MVEIGESSHVMEDAPVDKHIVPIEPTVPVVETEMAAEEYYIPEAEEPVIGGVMRMDGDAEDDDQVDESDPEEGEQELAPVERSGYASPEYYPVTEQQLIDHYTDRIIELGDETAQQASRIADLEEQNRTHQETEQQYRDLAYQRESEARELRQQLEQSELSRVELAEGRMLDGHQMMELGEQCIIAETRAAGFRAERDAARAELQIVKDELAHVEAARDFFHESWVTSASRVDELEDETRVNTTGFAMEIAISRMRDCVRRYPRDGERSRRMIRRRVVDRIIRREYRAAIRRSRQ